MMMSGQPMLSLIMGKKERKSCEELGCCYEGLSSRFLILNKRDKFNYRLTLGSSGPVFLLTRQGLSLKKKQFFFEKK